MENKTHKIKASDVAKQLNDLSPAEFKKARLQVNKTTSDEDLKDIDINPDSPLAKELLLSSLTSDQQSYLTTKISNIQSRLDYIEDKLAGLTETTCDVINNSKIEDFQKRDA